MKKEIVKLALMGLVVGSALCSCSKTEVADTDPTHTEKDKCTGPNGCDGTNNFQNNDSQALKSKREAAATELSK